MTFHHPANLEAEQIVLGCLMQEPETLPLQFEDLLKPTIFSTPAHRHILRAIMSLTRMERTADIVSVANWLEEQGVEDAAGGRLYLNDILAKAFSTTFFESNLAIIVDDGIRREVIDRAMVTAAQASDESVTMKDVQQSAEHLGLAFSENAPEFTTTSEVVGQVIQDIEDHLLGKGNLISTGFKTIDYFIGGFEPNLYIIAARPGVGKTTLAVNMAYRQAHALHPMHGRMILPGIISIEMSNEGLTQRLLSYELGGDCRIIPRGKTRAWWMEQLHQTGMKIARYPIILDDYSHIDIQTITAAAYKMVLQQKIDVLYIDYLQLVGTAERTQSREQELASVTRRLVGLRKDLGIPIIALCQMNRKIEDRKGHRPTLADLRESGAIEQDADVVMFLWDPAQFAAGSDSDRHDPVHNVQGIIEKHRHGRTGVAHLRFDQPAYRFDDTAPSVMEPSVEDDYEGRYE